MKKHLLLLLCLFTVRLLYAQDAVPISGRVTDAKTGEALIAVSVLVKGTTSGAQTDVEGNFTVNAPANATLVFSYIGYQQQEVPVNNRTTINVQLATDATQLNEVVVVGYGTQQKRDVTGSITSVKGDELIKQSSQNPVSSIQGRVAGVQITNTGTPGASPQVRIRGVGSAQGGVEPLYVVDGTFVPDLSFLNPADIESMEVLKDASSASIYGVRAANGVVLVTTRKGKAGAPRINYNGFAGIQKVTNRLEMANAQEYATLINEKFAIIEEPRTLPLTTPSTDWYDQVLRTAQVHNHQLSMSGGTERITYNFSGSYLNQQGIVKKNDFERITARLQTDFKVTNNIKVGYNAIFTNIKTDTIPSGVLYQAYVAPPILPVREANGRYGDPASINLGNFSNPQASLDWFNQVNRSQRLTGNVFGELTFLKDFTFRTSLGLNYGVSDYRNYKSRDSLTSIQFAERSLLTKGNLKSNSWLWENTLTYSKEIGANRFTVLLGISSQRDRWEEVIGTINDVPNNSEASYYFSLGDQATARIQNTGDLYTFASYFGRINYAFKDKYLLTTSLRYDGSSKFPEGNRFDIFPSVGLGWMVTEESFMKNQTAINNLKVRASWGKLGNSNIPSNVFNQTASLIPGYIAFFGGIPYTGGNFDQAVPPTLLWEVVKETDLGFEMVTLNNRLTVEADWYDKRTEDAIFRVPFLSSSGLGGSINGNFASFKNTGVEFAANWNTEATSNFRYNVGFNVAYNRNEVTNIDTSIPQYGGSGGVAGNLTTISRLGDPIGSFYGFVVDGVYQTEQEVTGSAQPAAKPGDFRYRDLNNDKVIDNRDRTIIGNPNPRFIYGINSGFNFYNFDLQLDIQGVAGVEIYNANKGNRFGNENYTKDFFENRWHGAGTSNSYPSADLSGVNLDPNSWYIENGDYIRIRNLQVGYTLPTNLTGKWKIQSIRFYANAQNPVTFFKYNGFTPEVGGPPTNAGIDLNVYPLSATYNFGVNVNF
ncbi:SusC/RagA family TonB-linked outer membrane protein [Adhaeribacter arboris]|uniref:SusC/RagA family TonB-linked outer membrane protein n=1 Tax=Adhaeribacter arboris TaxID=2072846 RepID=A0A2T2YCI4_9BACT|nr:TonB-dependent receptor [Adhaeribacter arboris]PSR53232.1 SusC/RagA family TonB-linked outer membrane protein [Adhaeribacter arboris]